MRRQRNTLMYETTPDPSESDLEQARIDVQSVIEVAKVGRGARLTATAPRRLATPSSVNAAIKQIADVRRQLARTRP